MVQSHIRSGLALQTVFFLFLFSSLADEARIVSIDSTSLIGIMQENTSVAPAVSHSSYPDSSDTSALLKTRKMIARLGDFHKSRGLLSVATGIAGIFAGVVLLDKSESTPLAISFMALGGVSIGFGIWEMKLGRTLLPLEKSIK